MATTIPTLSSAELRERLQELKDLAEGIVLAETEMREKAGELRRCDWDIGDRFVNALAGELAGVYELLVVNQPEDGLDAHDLVERIDDTIGVFDMAIRRGRDDA